MMVWSSLIVLSSLLVITSSFPSSDVYNIPEVGNGQRSQFYVLHDDGTFKYGYDTGDGTFESKKLHSSGDVEGKFGYTDPEGNRISLEYDSGPNGFEPRGSHIPQPSYPVPRLPRSDVPFVDPLADDSLDPSYNFGFQGEEYSRNEVNDNDGRVTGQYSYTDEFGRTRHYTYTAGKGIGFQIQGDDIPQDANSISSSSTSSFRTQTQFSPKPAQSFSNAHTRTQNLHNNENKRQFQSFRNTPVKTTSSSSSTRTSNRNFGAQSNNQRDASYSFSYNTDDHSRQETSDSNLNVQGSYSFVGDDGRTRTTDYVAGRGTGFKASGNHLPRPTQTNFGNRLSSSSHSTSSSSSNRQSNFRSQQSSRRPSSQPSNTLISSPQNTFTRTSQQANTRTRTNQVSLNTLAKTDYEPSNAVINTNPDGSYSFSHSSSGQSHSEAGSSDNTVQGNFQFITEDDGQQRNIQYEAGSETGFIAEGAHIPVGPVVPGAPNGQPTGRIVPVQEIPFFDPLADTANDASYDFTFDSETYSRTEAADEDGNVSGTYSVVDEEGVKRIYQFRAGKGIGYEVELVSESRVPVPLSGSQRQSSSSSGSSGSSFSSSNQVGINTSQTRTGNSSFRQNSQSTVNRAQFRPSQTTSNVLRKTSSFGTNRQNNVISSGSNLSDDVEIHRYEHGNNNGKFGYVVKYNN